MSVSVETLGPIATRKLQKAIAAAGCKDKRIKLPTFLAKLEMRKAPEGLSFRVQQLPGEKAILITYEDSRFSPKRDGYTFLRQYSGSSDLFVNITWRPVLDNGRFYLSPQLDLGGLEVKDDHRSDHKASLQSLILEVLGLVPVLLSGDFSDCLTSSQLPEAGPLRRLVDTYYSSPAILVGLGDAIALTEKYLASLRALEGTSSASLANTN